MSSPKGSDGKYPNNLNQLQKIQVPEGFTIWIRFTKFLVQAMDNVTITDSDGTNPGHINRVTLSDDSSRGYWDFEKEIMSRTNMVTVQFQTDADNNDFGWRLIWGEENFIF